MAKEENTNGSEPRATGIDELIRNLLGNELYEVAEAEHYHVKVHLGSVGGPTIYWGPESSVTNPRYFEKVFPPFAIYRTTENASYPVVTFLSNYWLKYDLKEARDIQKEEYRKAKDRFATEVNGYVAVPDEKIVRLSLHRDQLEKQLRHIGERIEEPIDDILSLLKVYAVEAERSIIDGRMWDDMEGPAEGVLEAPFTGGPDPEGLSERGILAKKLGECQEDLTRLWTAIIRGMPSRPLIENWIPKILYRENIPEKLSEVQEIGLHVHLKKRDEIIEEAVPYYRRYVPYSLLLQRALIDEPLMSDEEAARRGRPELADEDLLTTLRFTVAELRKQNGRATSFLDHICKAVADQLTLEGKLIDPGGIRYRLEKKVVPYLEERFPDLSFPEGAGMKAWQEFPDSLAEALARFEEK